MNQYTDFTQFPIGTEVYCPYGYGEIIDITDDKEYPIRVKAKRHEDCSFTRYGYRFTEDDFPSLFIKGHEPKNFYVEPPIKQFTMCVFWNEVPVRNMVLSKFKGRFIVDRMATYMTTGGTSYFNCKPVDDIPDLIEFYKELNNETAK